MKILLVVTGLGVGGAERLVTGLADRFVADGHEVVLAYFLGEPSFLPADSRVRSVNLHLDRHPIGLLAGLWRLRRLIQEFRPDVVNSHLVHANVLARLLRLVTPMRRLVSSAHNTNEEGRFRMLAYRLTDRLADVSTNVSDEAVAAFIEQGALRCGRMVTVHNGIDIDAFSFDADGRNKIRSELAVEEEAPVLLAVGRLWEQKDYPNLLTALAKLKASGYAPILLIVGDGPLRDELAGMAVSLGVAEQIRWLGVRHDVQAFLSACDVFVLSSAWEGFGLVVAEAMACERVVVATDSGGVREVVGDVGCLVPPRDSDAMAEALEHALTISREKREQIRHLSRARIIERYSLQATASRYLSVFRGERIESSISDGYE